MRTVRQRSWRGSRFDGCADLKECGVGCGNIRSSENHRLRSLRRKSDCQRTFVRAWRKTNADAAPLDEAARAAVRRDLETRTRAWAQDEDGLRCLRTELMDSVDRELVHCTFLALDSDTRTAVRERLPELPQSDADVQRYLAASALRICVLRAWAALYYRDHARDDWFDTYRRAAEMRKASAVRDLARLAGAPPGLAQSHRDAAVHGLNASLRMRLLQAPRGGKIGRRGLRSRLRGFLSGPYHGATNPNGLEDGRQESDS